MKGLKIKHSLIYSIENFFQDYVFKLINEYNFKSAVYTDKSVQNFLWIGFIKVFFPNFNKFLPGILFDPSLAGTINKKSFILILPDVLE